MDKRIINFAHYNSIVDISEIYKLNINNPYNIPHCLPGRSLPMYRIVFKDYSDTISYDMYFDKQILFDLFCTYINEVRETKKVTYLRMENIVYPDERYLFKSYDSDGILCKLFYNSPYKLYCDIYMAMEEIDGKETGRITIQFDFEYKFFFLKYKINPEPITLKLSTEQIIDLQTKVYRELSIED